MLIEDGDARMGEKGGSMKPFMRKIFGNDVFLLAPDRGAARPRE